MLEEPEVLVVSVESVELVDSVESAELVVVVVSEESVVSVTAEVLGGRWCWWCRWRPVWYISRPYSLACPVFVSE